MFRQHSRIVSFSVNYSESVKHVYKKQQVTNAEMVDEVSVVVSVVSSSVLAAIAGSDSSIGISVGIGVGVSGKIGSDPCPSSATSDASGEQKGLTHQSLR